MTIRSGLTVLLGVCVFSLGCGDGGPKSGVGKRPGAGSAGVSAISGSGGEAGEARPSSDHGGASEAGGGNPSGGGHGGSTGHGEGATAGTGAEEEGGAAGSKATAGTGAVSPAPALDPTVSSNFSDAFRFLYEGPTASQTGVAAGAISDRRIAIVRGLVEDMKAEPVKGVSISAPAHPEYGSTKTRADGSFDFVVNGGGSVLLAVQAAGFLPVQRELTPEWRTFEPLRPIFLTRVDTKVSEVSFGDTSSGGSIVGSTVSDRSGTRTASLFLGAGTGAELVLADGSRQALDTAHVHVTEYTAGDNGPKAMPATLPPQSGYTYAVEITLDEAEQAGATRVELSKPVAYYVENFLNFPVGEPVPAGSYDRASGRWITEPSGRVVAVVDVTAGRAALDTNGDGLADDASSLAALGVDDAELASVGARYAKGTSLWRVPLSHFSAWDFNWCFFGGLLDSIGGLFDGGGPFDDDCTSSGSLIECHNQVLGESVPLAGIGAGLHYRSDRVPGRREAYDFALALTKSPAPPKAKRVRFEMELLGRHITYVADAAPNLGYDFEWDGLDGYGRPWQGPAPVRYRVGYVYDGWYGHTPAFGAYGEDEGWAPVPDSGIAPAAGVTAEDDLVRRETTMWLGWQSTTLGTFDATALGFGGFTLGVHHAYDPSSQTLYLGTGSRRHAASSRDAVHTVIGALNGSNGTGDALSVHLDGPHGFALAPDGTLYVADEGGNRVVRLTLGGQVELVAGTGSAGYAGDGGSATSAELEQPLGLALASDGTLYIAERANQVVRRVKPDGTIETFAGGGTPASGNGDGGPARGAKFSEPHAVAVGLDGSLFVADALAPAVRRIGTDGVIQTVLGTGVAGDTGDGGPGTSARMTSPLGLAVGPDGSLYVSDFDAHRLRRLAPDGTVSTVAGTGIAGTTGDGGPATLAALSSPHTVDVGPDGSIYIADEGNLRVRKVTPDGIIHALSGGGTLRAAEFVPAEDAKFSQPRLVAVERDGRLLIGDYTDNVIDRLVPFLPSPDPNGYTIASDSGGDYFTFDANGRHLTTADAVTGRVRLRFDYDESGRLSRVVNGDGRKTTVERDSGGRATSLTSPDGLKTTLGYSAAGWLKTVTNPAGEVRRFTLADQGLLSAETDAAGRSHEFTFDELGRLTRDTEPSGAFQTLSRSSDHVAVTRTTARGLETIYTTRTLADGRLENTVTLPDGRTATTTATPGHELSLTPDGTAVEVTYAADPRFGLAAKFPATTTLTTPNGRSLSVARTRKVTLADAEDPTSVQAIESTLSANGTVVAKDAFTVATRTKTVTRFGQVTTLTYDTSDRLVQVAQGGRAPLTLGYDPSGRLTAITQKDRTTSFSYDDHGFLDGAVDSLGVPATFSHDAVGRTLGVDVSTASTGAKYDDAGELTAFVSGLGHEHSFALDAGGRIASYTAPALTGNPPRTTTFGYGIDDALESITYPSGRVLERTLDARGHTTAWTTPETTIQVTNDATTGHASTLDTTEESVAFAWDGPLLLSTTYGGTVAGAVTRTFDSALRLASETAGGSAASFAHDSYGRLTTAGSETLAYAANGVDLAKVTLGSVVETLAYSNDYGELATQTVAGGSSVGTLYAASFTRDRTGRILALDETVRGQSVSQAFEYDDLGRLVAATRAGVRTPYAYDADGNRLDTGGAVDAQDRLLSSGDATFGYDADGRLATVTRGASTTSYDYDTFGRLRRVDVPGHRIDYVVDAVGHRVGKKIDGTLDAGYLYDQAGRVLAELGPTGATLSRFVYASRLNVPDYLVKGGTTYRLVTDHLGSVRLVVDATTGSVAQALDYDAWGGVLSDSAPGFQPFGFAGGLYDRDTGLVHFGARDYDPGLGRWTAKDPILFAGGSLNLYAYAGNDPVNHIDPSGQCVSTGTLLGVAAVVGIGVVAIIAGPELLAAAGADAAVEGLGLAAIEGAEGAEALAAAVEGAEAVEASGVAAEGANAAIGTPYALEAQSMSAEAQAALSEVRSGASVFRTGELGESMAGESQYWSPTSPLSPGYGSQMGVPGVTPNFIMGGTVAPGASVITNEAAALGANAGGGIQVVTSPGGVTGLWFHMP